mgnify:CR=1 FL=1
MRMKQSGKITIILVLTILLVGFIAFKCYLTCKYDKLMSQIISDNQLMATYQQLPMVYYNTCLLYTYPSPRDRQKSRMPSSA